MQLNDAEIQQTNRIRDALALTPPDWQLAQRELFLVQAAYVKRSLAIPDHYQFLTDNDDFPADVMVFYYYNGGNIINDCITCYCNLETTPCSCGPTDGTFEFRARVVHNNTLIGQLDCMATMEERKMSEFGNPAPRLIFPFTIETALCVHVHLQKHWNEPRLALRQALLRLATQICGGNTDGVQFLSSTLTFGPHLG